MQQCVLVASARGKAHISISISIPIFPPSISHGRSVSILPLFVSVLVHRVHLASDTSSALACSRRRQHCPQSALALPDWTIRPVSARADAVRPHLAESATWTGPHLFPHRLKQRRSLQPTRALLYTDSSPAPSATPPGTLHLVTTAHPSSRGRSAYYAKRTPRRPHLRRPRPPARETLGRLCAPSDVSSSRWSSPSSRSSGTVSSTQFPMLPLASPRHLSRC